MAIFGRGDAAIELARAMGVPDPDGVTSVTLTLNVNEIATLSVQRFAHADAIDALAERYIVAERLAEDRVDSATTTSSGHAEVSGGSAGREKDAAEVSQ